jgi:hypothetical protein
MDRHKYLIEGHTNVFAYREPQDVHPMDRFVIKNSGTTDFINALLEVRPTWEFLCLSPLRSSDGTRNCSHFDVYNNGERLGDITVKTKYIPREAQNTWEYCYDTPRLNAARERGSWTKSTKLNVAVKGVVKAFTPKSLMERIDDASTALRSRVGGIKLRATQNFNDLTKPISTALYEYVMDNWEVVSSALADKGVETPKNVVEQYQRAKAAERLFKRYHTCGGAGATILLRGNDYIVVRDSGVEIKSGEELPPIIRRHIGLLKLVDDGQMVEDVGVREDDKTFFVLEEEDND